MKLPRPDRSTLVAYAIALPLVVGFAYFIDSHTPKKGQTPRQLESYVQNVISPISTADATKPFSLFPRIAGKIPKATLK